jgi:hypothetical protein
MTNHNPNTCPDRYASGGKVICPHTTPNPEVTL